MIPSTLIGLERKEKKINQYLEETCKICERHGISNRLLKNIDKNNLDQLFHQLHVYFKKKDQNGIVDINLQIEKLQIKNINETHYGYLYHFIRGVTLYKLELYQEAIEEFQQSLENTSDKYFQGHIWFNIATSYKELRLYDISLDCLSKAEKIYTDYNDLKFVYSHKADINMLLKKYGESEKIYKKVIEIETNLEDSASLILSYNDLANFYYQQYIDDKAIPLFKKALEIAKKVNDLEKLKDAHYNMHAVYRNLGDYKNALNELKIYQEITDTLDNAQRVRNLTNLEKEQEKQLLEERKNNEIAIVEKNNQLLTGGILATLAILGLLAYSYTNTRRQNKIIATQKQEVEQLNTIKDELLSVLGHDLRSPMQHLISVFDRSFRVLKKGDEQKLQRLLQHGNLAVNQTSILLDNVLQWVTQQNEKGYFQKETVALSPLVQQIQATFSPIMQMRQIELVNEVGQDTAVLADRNSLKIIIRNLVDNAIKFTPKKGQVTISSDTDSAGRQGIHIQDTGVGMSEAIKAKILAKTTASTDVNGRKSTGLGLRICKEFIERHGGGLTIESMEGEGSRFSVWLPVSVVG